VLVTLAFQGSLLDDGAVPSYKPLRSHIQRVQLSQGAWVDLCPGWVSGADELFMALLHDVPWQAERRQMYEREVAVPRLLCFYGEDQSLPHPMLDELKSTLSGHYRRELGEPFATAGLCLYRDGRDSVAPHGDTIGRSSTEDTMVAIISLGAPRVLTLKPRAGSAPAQRHRLGHGDLIVMGGSCQRTWLHGIPKTALPAGPRISVQFRPRGVR
jgi:alkylated DNA repair dioxygenase AlkB